MSILKTNDVLLVYSLDIIAGSVSKLYEILDALIKKKVVFKSELEGISSDSKEFESFFETLKDLTEFEKRCNIERRRAGQCREREMEHRGRKEKQVNTEQLAQLYKQYKNRDITKREIAETLKISRPKLDQLIRQYQLEDSKIID